MAAARYTRGEPKARYTKGGCEANAVAARIAHGATGRNLILYSGYHGWHGFAIRLGGFGRAERLAERAGTGQPRS